MQITSCASAARRCAPVEASTLPRRLRRLTAHAPTPRATTATKRSRCRLQPMREPHPELLSSNRTYADLAKWISPSSMASAVYSEPPLDLCHPQSAPGEYAQSSLSFMNCQTPKRRREAFKERQVAGTRYSANLQPDMPCSTCLTSSCRSLSACNQCALPDRSQRTERCSTRCCPIVPLRRISFRSLSVLTSNAKNPRDRFASERAK